MNFYGPQHKFEVDLGDYGTPPFDTVFTVVDEDSFTIASQEENACCLNFASHKRPGGGYTIPLKQSPSCL